jgi:hypothetical protein
MDVTLGPWTAEKSVDPKQGKTLAEAMGDEARKTAKSAGFTPQDAPQGNPAKSGFTISGKVVKVSKLGNKIQVKLMFTLWADGTFSNVAPLSGEGEAEGSSSAEDAVRAITEDRVDKLLEAIKSGRAAKAH